MNNGICITPTKNIVENIGFSNNTASHTSKNFWDSFFTIKRAKVMEFPLEHPEIIKLSFYLDKKELFMDVIRVILKKLF